MTHRLLADTQVSAETWDWEKDAEGHYQRINQGITSGQVEVLIDVDALVRAIGKRVLFNKSGDTKLQADAIIVRLVPGSKKVVPSA